LEHWGGATDGKIHYPITSLVFSVPVPSDEVKQGKVEYAHLAVVGGGAAAPAHSNEDARAAPDHDIQDGNF